MWGGLRRDGKQIYKKICMYLRKVAFEEHAYLWIKSRLVDSRTLGGGGTGVTANRCEFCFWGNEHILDLQQRCYMDI